MASTERRGDWESLRITLMCLAQLLREEHLAQLFREELSAVSEDQSRQCAITGSDESLMVRTIRGILHETLIAIAAQAGAGATYADKCQWAYNRWSGLTAERAETVSGLIGLVSLNARLIEWHMGARLTSETAEITDGFCAALVGDSSVRSAIQAVYGVDAARESSTNEAWRGLSFKEMGYLATGTTSFILSCARASSHTEHHSVAVKCVLFPWNEVPAIAEATREYADRYGASRAPIVKPESSTDSWVIMPLHPVDTLDVLLRSFAQRSPKPTPDQTLAFLNRIGTALFNTLELLADHRMLTALDDDHRHLDLTPANIMVEQNLADQVPVLSMLDLGRNHLYSRQVVAAEPEDGHYIAPEVKAGGSSATSDVFSVGMILIEIVAGKGREGGRVPDEIYQLSPGLARFVEDLVDDNPDYRLLLHPAGRDASYETLRAAWHETVAMVAEEPALKASRFERIIAQYAPASREPWSLWRKARVASHSDPHLRYLYGFSFAAAAIWAMTWSTTAIVTLGDAVRGEALHPHGVQGAAALIAFTQGLVASKYYQTILARLTLRPPRGPLEVAGEISLRVMPFVAVPTVAVAIFGRPDLWPWACAFGATLVSIGNLLLLQIVRSVRESEVKFSTTPRLSAPLPGGFEQWWWTMAMYAMIICVIAAGLQIRDLQIGGLHFGGLRDLWAYVWGLVLVSLGVHYASKCVNAGSQVRGGLARAIVTAERLDKVLQKGSHS